jgi:PhoH-like ATPase
MSEVKLVINSSDDSTSSNPILYVLDTNVLIHDPTAILNFDEHHVVIPITVLEELDTLKSGRQSIAADCRQVIRELDKLLGRASPGDVETGVAIPRGADGATGGTLSVLMTEVPDNLVMLPTHLNDNKILNDVGFLKKNFPSRRVVLVTKDINVRLKARGCGIESQDYHSDQLLNDIEQINKGYLEFSGSFWERIENVTTQQEEGKTFHCIARNSFDQEVFPNQFLTDESGFLARVVEVNEEEVKLLHLDPEQLMATETWGLYPQDIYQAMAMDLLLDPDVHLVNLTGSAGSGKTILALAACIEQTVPNKIYRRIIVTRSTQGLDEDIGFLPGTEEEKMEPWLGAITDNLEALHWDDENCGSSMEYVMDKVPLRFKSLNYIRGRSFQGSLILIDESQNLTPHQIKTIVTRAGSGSKVICLGNLAQIDTPYLTATSSGLTYLTERFKNFKQGGNILLQGVPRSALAEFAEEHL